MVELAGEQRMDHCLASSSRLANLRLLKGVFQSGSFIRLLAGYLLCDVYLRFISVEAAGNHSGTRSATICREEEEHK
jgi:hypothetical protein